MSQALCSVNSTGVVLSLLAVPRGSLDTLRLFLHVSLGFASTQLIPGMAVCWHDFFKLDLCPQLACKLLRDIILNTLTNLLAPPPRGRTAWHKGPHHTRPWRPCYKVWILSCYKAWILSCAVESLWRSFKQRSDILPCTFCRDYSGCCVMNGVGEGVEMRKPVWRLLHNPGKR